jgi:glycosyltransferase involved in cell wall biosynthesis
MTPVLTTHDRPSIAVLLPCYNEATAVGDVVRAFMKELPEAVVYVFDNNSTDGTAEVARAAGAVVHTEHLQGKGNVVCRMFADIEADIYVLSDGDSTYDVSAAPQMIQRLLDRHLDMVVGARVAETQAAYPRGHVFGNAVFNGLVSRLFGNSFKDLFSGYRVFSRRFAKTFPELSTGFEIETQLSVHALEMKMKTLEVPTRYLERPDGSVSKLRTYRDGTIILSSILILLREIKPAVFYGIAAAVLAVIGLAIGSGPVVDYIETGLVPRLPRAVLASAVMILSALSLLAGIVLESLSRSRREMKRLAYLQQPWMTCVPGGFSLGRPQVSTVATLPK